MSLVDHVRTTASGLVVGLGHIFNLSHRFTNVALALAQRGGSAPVPAQGLDFRQGPYLPGVFDQGPIGACEGHAASAAIVGCLQRQGVPALGFVPSMDDLYRLARAIDRNDPSVPLTDSGTEGNSIIRVMQEFGVRAMTTSFTSDGRFSDCSPDTVNNEPLILDMERDAQHLEIGAYSILETSANDVADAYMQSLLAFGPIPTASVVDTAFMNWDPSKGPVDTVDYNDPQGGGHKILCVGWRWVDSTGRIVTSASPGAVRQWIVRNSWGTTWGDAGYFYATDNWLAQTDEREVYALKNNGARRSAVAARTAVAPLLTKKAS